MTICVCGVCATTFQRPPSVIAKGKGRYCSKPCYTKAQTHEVKRPGKQERRCQECGSVFYTYPAAPTRFCQRACRSAWDRRPDVIAARFWAFYDRSGDCWIWTGSVTNAGYGKFGFHTKQGMRHISAHRMAWILAHSQWIPNDMNVCHSCDVKLCGKPEHLFLGTQQDNIRDMFTKGRNSFHLPDGSTWSP